jgi:hypothetical protein
MMKPWDRRIFLIAVAAFGAAGTRAGYNWLSAGSIVIGDASAQVAVDGPPPRPHPPSPARFRPTTFFTTRSASRGSRWASRWSPSSRSPS